LLVLAVTLAVLAPEPSLLVPHSLIPAHCMDLLGVTEPEGSEFGELMAFSPLRRRLSESKLGVLVRKDGI
jgi:hypothetical protein